MIWGGVTGDLHFSWVLRGLGLVSRQISLYSWNVPLVAEGAKACREVGAGQCENPRRGLLGSSWGYENTVGVGLTVPGPPTTGCGPHEEKGFTLHTYLG